MPHAGGFVYPSPPSVNITSSKRDDPLWQSRKNKAKHEQTKALHLLRYFPKSERIERRALLLQQTRNYDRKFTFLY